MKALILNSGMGTRMQEGNSNTADKRPKCMTILGDGKTIVERQLQQLSEIGVDEVIMTVGHLSDKLVEYCDSLATTVKITYIKNEQYAQTNYIESMRLASAYLKCDFILLHGDMVFENLVLDKLVAQENSSVIVSTVEPYPEKDFKAFAKDNLVKKISVECENATSALLPMYLIKKSDALIWLEAIERYCSQGKTKCYAEDALNECFEEISLYALDVREQLACEIDTMNDLAKVNYRLEQLNSRTVYMCFTTDILHHVHIKIINRAKRLGKLIIGVLSDEAVLGYRRFQKSSTKERMQLFENVAGVYKVVEQRTLSYKENLEKYKPNFVVHGDNWVTNKQRPIRDEVVAMLASYGGVLVEYPYTVSAQYSQMVKNSQLDVSSPDYRRARLQRAINAKGLITAIEAHSGLTGLIAEKTTVEKDGATYQFDAMWMSSLCDSTAKGKPDIELVDSTSRFKAIDEIMDVTTKPIIYDGDTGGLLEHFVYTVKTLERLGVSMVIIEDKQGLKRNSLFGTGAHQTQASIEDFCNKITAGKKAQKSNTFMICARVESLILEMGVDDALKRAHAYVKAGADAIMIHSKKKEPDEIFDFVAKFRSNDATTPIVVVPTSFTSVTEAEFKARGVNIVIYANQLSRSGFPAMQKAARLILSNHRALECDDICMKFSEIITLIPEEF